MSARDRGGLWSDWHRVDRYARNVKFHSGQVKCELSNDLAISLTLCEITNPASGRLRRFTTVSVTHPVIMLLRIRYSSSFNHTYDLAALINCVPSTERPWRSAHHTSGFCWTGRRPRDEERATPSIWSTVRAIDDLPATLTEAAIWRLPRAAQAQVGPLADRCHQAGWRPTIALR